MTESTSPVVRPSVEFLDDLLSQIEKGALRVPRFQRPFQWRPMQMTALLDSVLSGYPIGSLLLWESNREIDSMDRIGPVAVAAPPAERLSFVLDGHQRLSTLYGTLRLPAELVLDKPGDWIWQIWYDLREREFIHHTRGPRPPHFLAVRSLSRTLDFIRECRRINEECRRDAETLIQEAESVASRIKSYKVPINVISGEMEQAVETFSRLNSTGRKISVDQMVSALTYRQGPHPFHLESRLDRILETLTESGFGAVSRKIVFRTIIAAMGMNVYETKWTKLTSKMTPALPVISDQVEESLLRATEFLEEYCGVPCAAVLPYEPQLMLFSHYHSRGGNFAPPHRAALVKWFWRTSFSGFFAGTSDSQMNRYLNDMEEFVASGDEGLLSASLEKPTSPLPTYFNMRNARVRTFVLFLRSLNPHSLDTGEPLGTDTLLKVEGPAALAYIVPGRGSALGNRILAGGDSARHVMEKVSRMAARGRWDVLESHGITSEGYELLKMGNVDLFIAQRGERLASLEQLFMSSHDVATPVSRYAGETGALDDAVDDV